MKKILFVDDEERILQGLQRMLRPLRNEWNMNFVGSGKSALEILEKEPFDVVVSDMRMPGMDGAQLLNEVMKRYPDMVRIILSGYSDQGLILSSIGPTHQFVAKPCDAESLKNIISRACALRDLFADAPLKKLVSGIESLPSLPSLYIDILEELNKPDASIKKISDIISQDISMTAKILQMINSAFFGLPQNISEVSQAVNLLGIDTIKTLVLSVQVFSQFDKSIEENKYLESLFKHCTTVASYARKICIEEKADIRIKDDSFLAGMLHRVGTLILASNMPEQFLEILNLAEQENILVADAEKNIVGATHNDLGAYLLGLWGFSDPVVEAVAFYNYPGNCLSNIFCPLTAVHVGNILAEENSSVSIGGAAQIDEEYLSELNLADHVPVWRKSCDSV